MALKGAAKNQLLSHDGSETMKERGLAEKVVDAGEIKSQREEVGCVPAQALNPVGCFLVWFRRALTISEGHVTGVMLSLVCILQSIVEQCITACSNVLMSLKGFKLHGFT